MKAEMNLFRRLEEEEEKEEEAEWKMKSALAED